MISSAINKVSNIVQFGEKVINAVKSSAARNRITALYTSCLDYKKQAEEAVETARSIKDCVSLIASEAPALFQHIKRSKSRTIDKVQKFLKHAPNEEAFFQLIAQEVSYRTWKPGDTLKPSKHFNCPTYTVKELIHFTGGITGVVLTAKNQPPIIAFRGTDTSNHENLKDDLHEKIGQLNCTRYAKDLAALLERVATEHGRIHIMGHSYGGTVAQRLTVAHPQLIQRCTHHNAPGVGRETVEEYRKNLEKLSQDCPRPSIWSYRHAKDIVSFLGGDHLPVDHGRDYTASTPHDSISHVQAHSANTISDGKQLFVGKHASDNLKQCAAFVESIRRKTATR